MREAYLGRTVPREFVAVRYDRQIIGYHACTQAVADRLLVHGEAFRESTNAWDWLGRGVYFWEYGHQRAHDWATQWPKLRGKRFAVVGAIIQLGACLDLLDTDHTRHLAEFASAFVARSGPLPPNDGTRRRGDCLLINSFCASAEARGAGHDTVRGLFQEGEPVAVGTMILSQNHIQVAVRRPHAIIGLFRPREFSTWRAA